VLTPLGAVTVAALTQELEVIKIKVPLGLPDPTPHIPPSNPPTLAKWHLGKKLFFTRDLLPTSAHTGKSCVTCHNPVEGYTTRDPFKPGMKVNTLSLLNVAYNQRLFWNGRVEALEQMIQRDRDDEGQSPTTLPEWEYRHVWGGVVKRLNDRKEFRKEFERVFGAGPSIDSVGKALATYLRTLLVGDSLYDLAEKTRQDRQAKELTAEHFLPHLKGEGVMRRLEREGKEEDVAKELERGYRLFVKSRCNQCHSGPLFTDQDYHNIGVDINNIDGRRITAPVGLKDRRYFGAFRTPTLRNLPRTKPYFHTGKMETLREVLKHYNEDIHDQLASRHLDPVLLDPATGATRSLRLPREELDALEVFLRALDGGEVPAWVADEPKK
jgi:cytochrome c peroxidase